MDTDRHRWLAPALALSVFICVHLWLIFLSSIFTFCRILSRHKEGSRKAQSRKEFCRNANNRPPKRDVANARRWMKEIRG